MTREASLHTFFNSFGIPAYKVTEIPDDVVFPYMTYTDECTGFYDAPASISVSVYYYTESESQPNSKVRDIEAKIGNGGHIVKYDNGGVWLTKGTPWCQSLTDATSPTIKVRFLNINRHELTSV